MLSKIRKKIIALPVANVQEILKDILDVLEIMDAATAIKNHEDALAMQEVITHNPDEIQLSDEKESPEEDSLSDLLKRYSNYIKTGV